MTIKSGKAKLAGVMGWPVSHSRSPILHGYWLKKHGIDGAYVPLAVKPDQFQDALRALPQLGFQGVNVTVPHKEQALRLVDHLDDLAARIGAVNTILFCDGQIFGQNTDAFGFMENLRDRAPMWRVSNGPAVVLGAGGAARAIIVGLLDAGVNEIRLLNRTLARADQLAAELGPQRIKVWPWDQRDQALAEAGLVVNTTTLGLNGTDPLDLALDLLPAQAVVSDIVYTPLETALLAQAKARGLHTVDGLGMLIHQARPGFEAWFGQAVSPDDELRAMLVADLTA